MLRHDECCIQIVLNLPYKSDKILKLGFKKTYLTYMLKIPSLPRPRHFLGS